MSCRKIVKSDRTIYVKHCSYSTILVQCYAFSLLSGFSWFVYPGVPTLGEGEAEGEEHTSDTGGHTSLLQATLMISVKNWANDRQAQYSFERGERKVTLWGYYL